MTDMLRKRAMHPKPRLSYGSPNNASESPSPMSPSREEVDSIISESRSEIINLTQVRVPASFPTSLSVADERTFEVSTEKGGRRLMSEEEVSSLVHNALRRARKATSSVSPRRRTLNNLGTSKSPSVLSPSSQASPRFGGSNHSKPPTSPTKKSIFLPGDEELSPTKSSFPRQRSSRTPSYSKYSSPGPASPYGDLSSAPSDYTGDIDAQTTEDYEGSFSAPTLSTVNSSDAIIKRVEEEIANARKAAQEANRRLAGVSAGYEFPSISSRDLSAATGSSSVKSDSIDSDVLHGFLSISDGADSDEDEYDAALDVIGEEFDMKKSFDTSVGRYDSTLSAGEPPSLAKRHSETATGNWFETKQTNENFTIELIHDLTNVSDGDDRYGFKAGSLSHSFGEPAQSLSELSKGNGKEIYSVSSKSRDATEMPDDERKSYNDKYASGNIGISTSEYTDPVLEPRAPAYKEDWSKFIYRETKTVTSEESKDKTPPTQVKKGRKFIYGETKTVGSEKSDDKAPPKQVKKESTFPDRFSAQGNAFMQSIGKARVQEDPSSNNVLPNDEAVNKFPDRFSTQGNAFMKVIEKGRATEETTNRSNSGYTAYDYFSRSQLISAGSKTNKGGSEEFADSALSLTDRRRIDMENEGSSATDLAVKRIASDLKEAAQTDQEVDDAIVQNGTEESSEPMVVNETFSASECEDTVEEKAAISVEEAYEAFFGERLEEINSLKSASNEEKVCANDKLEASLNSGSATACLTDDSASVGALNPVATDESQEFLLKKKAKIAADDSEEKKEEPESEWLPVATSSNYIEDEEGKEIEMIGEPVMDEEIEIAAIVLEEIENESTEEPNEDIKKESTAESNDSSSSTSLPDAFDWTASEEKMESGVPSSEDSTVVAANSWEAKEPNENMESGVPPSEESIVVAANSWETKEPNESMESGVPSSEEPTVVAANSWEAKEPNERKEPLFIHARSKEDDEEEDYMDSQSVNSEEAVKGAISSPRRNFWWNKVEEKEAKKREARSNEPSASTPEGDEKQSETGPTHEIIDLVDSEETSEQMTIDPVKTQRAPTTTTRSLQPPTPQPVPRSPSPFRSNRSPSPQRASRAPSPLRSASPAQTTGRAQSAQRAFRHRSASPSPNVSAPSPGRSASPARAPSPQRVALVEHRRAERSRTNEVRAAISEELGISDQRQHPEEPIPTIRSKKVRFRHRYPVPPLIAKPRPPLEIIKDNELEIPGYNLRLAKPKKDLQELFDAASGSSLQRRSNACGALKVLTTQKKNKLTLVRTEGFLKALVFAAESIIPSRDHEIAIDARTRAVNTILNVSEPKDNRAIVLSHPGLPQCLVKCIFEDRGEARASACCALALLAKTPYCREPMAHVEKLIDVLAKILKGVKDEPAEPVVQIQYSADDEYSQNENGIPRSFSSGSSSTSSSLGNGSSRSDGVGHLPHVPSLRQQKIEQNEEMAKRARLNACATLVHLSKHCSVTPLFCSNEKLMDSLVTVSREHDNPIHTKCLEALCNMTRFPENNASMAKYPGLVDALVFNGNAKCDADRLWVLRTFQNLSSVVAGKTMLANSVVLKLLSVSVMRKGHHDEQVAATSTLYNLSTEPGAVVPLTNTKNVVATLVHVAHSPETATAVRLMACDALATLGLWLQTLAGAGTTPDGIDQAPLPSYATTGWNRWD